VEETAKSGRTERAKSETYMAEVKTVEEQAGRGRKANSRGCKKSSRGQKRGADVRKRSEWKKARREHKRAEGGLNGQKGVNIAHKRLRYKGRGQGEGKMWQLENNKEQKESTGCK
jgi:hypothetical protein